MGPLNTGSVLFFDFRPFNLQYVASERNTGAGNRKESRNGDPEISSLRKVKGLHAGREKARREEPGIEKKGEGERGGILKRRGVGGTNPGRGDVTPAASPGHD